MNYRQSIKMTKLAKGKHEKAETNNNNVFQPLEIGLGMGNKTKLQKIIRSQDDCPVPQNIVEQPPYSQDNRKIESGDGLITILQHQDVKPVILVCITVYNESRKDLNCTLDGLLSNLDNFKQAGIQNHQIAVVVVYDGIDRVNNDKHSNELNMMKNFVDIDRQYKIPQDQSMQKQHDDFKRFLGYSKIDINKVRKTKDFSAFEKDPYIQKVRQQELDKITVELNKLMKETFEIDLLEKIKAQGKKYLEQRKQTAWLYQTRKTIEKIGTERDLKQQKKEKKLEKHQQVKNKDQQSMLNYQQTRLGQQTFMGNNEYTKLNEQDLKERESQEDQENFLYMFYCVKHTNGGKLNSHLWFFEGFCELFDPKYTILIDCGLEPQPQSIFDFYLAMETDKDIGGVCGFMGLRIENVYTEAGARLDGYDRNFIDPVTRFFDYCFSIQRAQMFEYNFAHIIDKSFESLFGFIHVLPGAFSGYRWESLKKDEYGCSILSDYLQTVKDPNKELTIEEANMYLAEDRILCLKIYTKAGKRYKLRYIPTAHAIVDPVTTLPRMMGQRRRWINGTYFALSHVIANRQDVYKSEHSLWEMFWFMASMYYAWTNQIVTYIIIGLFISTMSMVFEILFADLALHIGVNQENTLLNFNSWFMFIYVMLICMMIFYSINFNVNNQRANCKFYCASTFLGLIMLFAFAMTMYTAILIMMGKSEAGQNDSKALQISVQIGVSISLGAFILPVVFNMNKVWQLLRSLPSFIYFTPTYIHTLVIYAFCRIDDLSWGTRGDEGKSANSQNIVKWKKYAWVINWVTINVMLAVGFQVLMGLDNKEYISSSIQMDDIMDGENDDKLRFLMDYGQEDIQLMVDQHQYRILESEGQIIKIDLIETFYVREIVIFALLGFSLFQVLCRVVGAIIYYMYFYGYFVPKMRRKQMEIKKDTDLKGRQSKQRLNRFFNDNKQQITNG